jgi:hypothetical protein
MDDYLLQQKIDMKFLVILGKIPVHTKCRTPMFQRTMLLPSSFHLAVGDSKVF